MLKVYHDNIFCGKCHVIIHNYIIMLLIPVLAIGEMLQLVAAIYHNNWANEVISHLTHVSQSAWHVNLTWWRMHMECCFCQNPTFYKDMILDGYLEKWMWTFTK